VAAMVSSFGVSIVLLGLGRAGVVVSTHRALVLTVAVTTLCWVLTAYLTPETDRAVLIEFYRKVRPAGPGWEPIRAAAGVSRDESTVADNIPLAMLGWAAGCMTIWAALFTVGNFLYGRIGYGITLLGIFIVSGLVLLAVIRRLWAYGPTGA
jgi:hypothetical protein